MTPTQKPHHHHHTHTLTSLNRAFLWGISLNAGFVIIEFAVGLFYGSMGLLSDAGHNLSDVASLLLAMLAFRLAQVHATPHYTYGYKKSTVLISLLNSVILLIAVGMIIAESIGRMFHPAPVRGRSDRLDGGYRRRGQRLHGLAFHEGPRTVT